MTARCCPRFITVSNIESRDPDKVRAGNERVVRPRLADAAFFWEQDRKQPLAAHRRRLDAVTFQAQLGSLGDKARRVAALARAIAAGRRPRIAQSRDARRGALQVRSADRHGRASSPSCRESWAATTRSPTASPPRSPTRSASTTCRAAPAMRCRRRHAGDSRSRSPTSSTRSPASSPSARSRAAPRIRSGCGAPPSACCASSSRSGSSSICALIAQALDAARADIERLRSSPPADRAAREPPKRRGDLRLPHGAAARLLPGGAGAAATPGRAAITTEMFDAVLADAPGSPLDFDARLQALRAFLAAAGGREPHGRQQAHRQHPEARRTPAPARGASTCAAAEAAEVRLYDAMRALRDAVAAAHRTARVRRGARAPGAAATGGRCVLRSGHGDG